MRIEVGAPVLLTAAAPTLWHVLARQELDYKHDRLFALCGLTGELYRYDALVRRGRHCCQVCLRRSPAIVHDPAAGELAELEQELHPRRRGGRPVGSVRRLTEAQVRVLHRLYVDEQVSCRALGARVWQRAGYRSANSAAVAIDKAFRELGLPLRTQPEALVLRNTRHGRATRELRAAGGDAGPDGYRQWLRREQGAYRPRCAGVRTQYPAKGEPCQRPAMVGSDYCFGHDPARAEEREANLARMRGRQHGGLEVAA
jgi:hypothetical protein